MASCGCGASDCYIDSNNRLRCSECSRVRIDLNKHECRNKQLREFADTYFDVMYLRFARQTRLLSGVCAVVDPVEPDLSLDGMSRMMQIVHDDAVRTAAVAISSKYPEAANHIMDNVYRGVIRYPK